MANQQPGGVGIGTGVLVLLIAILAQYIITIWVIRYSADTTLTTQVSFAGTIVSIVLALLAIVYSYYQGFAQQRDAVTLSSQIALLKDTVQRVNTANEGLARDLGRLSDLGDKVDRSIAAVEASRASSDAMRVQLSELGNKIEQTAARSTTPGRAASVEPVARSLVSAADSSQLAIYFAIKEGLRQHRDVDAVFESNIEPALKARGHQSLAEYIEGFYAGTWYMLLDLDLLTVRVADGKPRIQSLSPAFVSELDKRISTKPKIDKDAFLDVASVEATFHASASSDREHTEPGKSGGDAS